MKKMPIGMMFIVIYLVLVMCYFSVSFVIWTFRFTWPDPLVGVIILLAACSLFAILAKKKWGSWVLYLTFIYYFAYMAGVIYLLHGFGAMRQDPLFVFLAYFIAFLNLLFMSYSYLKRDYFKG